MTAEVPGGEPDGAAFARWTSVASRCCANARSTYRRTAHNPRYVK